MTDQTTPPAQQWAIVELFGHQRIAGAISEQVLGSASFVRVDVPELDIKERAFDHAAGAWVDRPVKIAAHTRSFGAAAIYSINWVDEITARIAAAGTKHRPVSEYTVREAIASLPQKDRVALLANDVANDAADL